MVTLPPVQNSRITDFLSRIAILVIVIVGIVGVFGWYLPLIKSNQGIRQEIEEQQVTIAELEAENQSMADRINSYKGSASAVERLARENLGLAKPGELIFRFQPASEKPRKPTAPGANLQ